MHYTGTRCNCIAIYILDLYIYIYNYKFNTDIRFIGTTDTASTDLRQQKRGKKTPTVAVTPAYADASLSTTVVQPFRQPHELRLYYQVIAERTSSQWT